MGTLLLERFSGDMAMVGYLNAGIRIQDAYLLAPVTLMAAAYPIFCRIHDKARTTWELVDLLTRVLLGIAVPVGATLFIASEPLTVLLFGEPYRDAHHAVGLYGITLISLTQVHVIGGLVSASGLQSLANRLLAGAFVVSLSLYLLSADGFTHQTAALLGLVDQTLIWIVNAVIAVRFLRGWTYLATFGKAFLFPLIAWGVVGWMGWNGEGLLLPLGVFLWTAMGMVATGVVLPRDLRRAKSLNQALSEAQV
jgi:O-antigen/teichoic acid export membrane protein